MSIGPVEYILIGFPGNNFHGEIAPALARLIENGTVRIIDLVFIGKDPEGNVVTIEFDQLEELAPFAALEGEAGGLVSEEDVAYAGGRARAQLVGPADRVGGHLGDRARRGGLERRRSGARRSQDPPRAGRGGHGRAQRGRLTDDYRKGDLRS